jgi:hypothetical protein
MSIALDGGRRKRLVRKKRAGLPPSRLRATVDKELAPLRTKGPLAQASGAAAEGFRKRPIPLLIDPAGLCRVGVELRGERLELIERRFRVAFRRRG